MTTQTVKPAQSDWTGLFFTASFSHKESFPVRFDCFKEVRTVMLQLIVSDPLDVHHVLFAPGHLFGKFPEGCIRKDILLPDPIFIRKPLSCIGKLAEQQFIRGGGCADIHFFIEMLSEWHCHEFSRPVEHRGAFLDGIEMLLLYME